MPQLIYNNAYNSKNHPTSLDSFIDYFIEKDNCSVGILIVPTHKYVNYIKKCWITKYFKHHNRALGKLHIYNLIDFAKLCLKEISKEDINIYSDAALLSIMEEAILSTGLRYYSNKNNRVSQSILEKIFAIIDGLRKDGITAEHMEYELEVKQDVSSAEKRFNDIANIYKRYSELLQSKANNKFDETGIYKQLKHHSINHNLSFIKPESIIYFHNFTEFKQPEAEFVAMFNDCNVPTFVNIDYSKLSGPEINNLPNNIRRLIINDMNNSLQIGNNDLQIGNNKFNNGYLPIVESSKSIIESHIKKWLFNENDNLYKEELKKQIKIYEAKDRINEVKSIVKLVIHLHREKDIDFADMCVCSRQSSTYSELFREYFSESGVVVNISDRYDLASAPQIVLLFSLLDLIVRRWRRSDIERLQSFIEIKEYLDNEGKIAIMGNNYSTISNYPLLKCEKSKEFEEKSNSREIDSISIFGQFNPSNLHILVKIAQTYRIVGGWNKNNWLKSLEQAKSFIEIEIKKINNGQMPVVDDKNIVVEGKDKFKEYENILIATNTFTKLVELLNFNSKDAFSNYVNRIKDIINALGIEKNIYKEAKKLLTMDNYPLPTHFDINKFQLLEEIEKKSRALVAFNDLLDELSDIEGTKEYSLIDFISKLKTAVSSTKYQLSEKDNIGINITSIEQTRGIPYRVLILCGALEGEFPLAFRTDKFLGKELKYSEAIHYDNEKLLFYKFLTNNVDLLEKREMELYIFYPSGVNSIRTIRSSFIDELCNIIDKEQVSEHIVNLNSDKDIIWNNYITTNLEILSRTDLGKDNGNNRYLAILKCNNLDINEHKNITEALKDNVYSVSQLETYADCGLKYFYKYLLKIKEPIKTEAHYFSALDLGNYYHKILQEFYENIRIKYNITDIKECNSELFDELMAIADNHLKNYNEMPLFVYEIAKIKHTFRWWFEKEIEKQNQNGGWRFNSLAFELKFGYDNNAIEIKVGKDTLKIKGSIDRVEINADTGEYIIADYKLTMNGVKKESDITDGKALQLPLYLLSLHNIPEYSNYKPYNGVYYVLNTDKEMVNWLIKKGEIDILNVALDKAIEYKNKIEKLCFQPINYNIKKNLLLCNYCPYKQFCRINDKIALHL
jgi:ATP-dependent helicase/DNAse subunit B